ncbi:hypothetical protein [Mesorhizobium mediterraneum]|uniref:hypothetical protein n=1 Tax=Mesorhizobium mediterraneum TaxID=43617 RepID=UPI001781B072
MIAAVVSRHSRMADWPRSITSCCDGWQAVRECWIRHSRFARRKDKPAAAPESSPLLLATGHVANAVLTIYESVLLARKQGMGWSVGDDDLACIDETLAALGIVDIAFRNTG